MSVAKKTVNGIAKKKNDGPPCVYIQIYSRYQIRNKEPLSRSGVRQKISEHIIRSDDLLCRSSIST